MKSTALFPPNPDVFVSVFAVLLALSPVAAESSTVQSPSGSSDDLRIVPCADPGVVGVVRVPTPAGAGMPAPDAAEPGEAAWHTDFAAARDQASREQKLVLLNFTGSDWCIWCRRLEADVFSKPEFGAYAARHLVLVKVDFPRKTRLPAAEAAQNARLQRQFGVRGFPTLIAVDASGRKVAEIKGYVRGGPNAFLSVLEKQLR